MDTRNFDSAIEAYGILQADLSRGWNTWDVRSMLSHMRLPDGLCIRLGIKEFANGKFLAEALAGRHGDGLEQVRPGVRTFDGTFTELDLAWEGVNVRIQSTADDEGLVIRVVPLSRGPETGALRAPVLVVSAGYAWNREGTIRREGDNLLAESPHSAPSTIRCDGPVGNDRNVPIIGHYQTLTLGEAPITICVGAMRSAEAARQLLESRRAEMIEELRRSDGESSEIAAAIQSSLAWDTIYDPDNRRVISPVSRVWSSSQGGWVLFCWDTYFAGLLAGAMGHRQLAYANVVEITRHAVEAGFVPNTTNAHGFVTRDRSQPPVGGIAVLQLYERFGDLWLVRLLFDPLLKWNRWWATTRDVGGGRLAWGSNAYVPVVGNEYEMPKMGVGGRFGSALESGMDNSPAYDDVGYDTAGETLELADVGLTSLYVADCEALAEMAMLLERDDDVSELRARAAAYRSGLSTLWSAEHGMFANRCTRTGAVDLRYTPANFYPFLVTDLATSAQAEAMLIHLMNPAEFGGSWMLPSITRSNPAYAEQHYWRGRIWPPHLYLVWLGLQRSQLTEAADRVARSASALLLNEWRTHGHVHENYHGDSGAGCGYRWSDPHYHWGGLLGVPSLKGR